MAHPYKMQGMMTAFGSKQGITVVARDGDVLLALKETTIRVSSVHLTGLSPFFKVMLGPNFSEGQAARSALVPKRIEMPDDDSVGMVLLCYYVHSGLERVQPLITGFKYYQDIMPTTERIAQLAVAADKYFLLDYLKERDMSRLFHPFRKAGIRYGLTLEQMADLAVAAYLFGQDDLFSLFTRCLILDFSDLPGLATTRFATHIGSQSMGKYSTALISTAQLH